VQAGAEGADEIEEDVGVHALGPAYSVGSNSVDEAIGTRIVAHRGGMAEACESSLAAFASAQARGADGIELDVHPAADGALVVHHDPTLARSLGDPRPICLLSGAELTRLAEAHGGERAPFARLEEVLAVSQGLWVSVDVKEVGPDPEVTVARVVGALRDAGALERAVVASFDRRTLAQVRAAWPEVRTTASPSELARWLAGVPARKLGFGMVSMPLRFGGVRLLGPSVVARARRDEVPLWVWTLNDPAELAWAFALGVDAVITDAPKLAANVRSRVAHQAV